VFFSRVTPFQISIIFYAPLTCENKIRVDTCFVQILACFCAKQAYLREAKCHLALGNGQAAILSLQKAKDLDPASDHAIMAEVG